MNIKFRRRARYPHWYGMEKVNMPAVGMFLMNHILETHGIQLPKFKNTQVYYGVYNQFYLGEGMNASSMSILIKRSSLERGLKQNKELIKACVTWRLENS
jgi:hypothetical protein